MNSSSCNLNQFSLGYIFSWIYADFWVTNYKWWKIYLQSSVSQNVQHPIFICAGTGRPNPDINDITLSEEKDKPRLINKFLNVNLIPSKKTPLNLWKLSNMICAAFLHSNESLTKH